MKYAIVDKNKAVAEGIKEDYHLVSNDNKKMVVNENEIRVLKNATKLGVKLIDRRELKTILNSDTWNK